MRLSEAETVVTEQVYFPAGPYRLHGALAYGEDVRTPRGAVVLACSHPLLGGNLDNNVIRGLGDGLAERERITLRFNYRGVGRSEGARADVAQHLAQFWQTSHVPGEIEDYGQDLQAAVAFLRQHIPAMLPLTLIGYSFGCALLPEVDATGRNVAYVLLAPPLDKHDYERLANVAGPILVIASDDDFTTDVGRLRHWFEQLPAPKRLIQTSLDNHFFRGHEPWLEEKVQEFLDEHGR